MQNKNENGSKRPFKAERPFPWRCRHCGQKEVQLQTISYTAEVLYNGNLHSFTVNHLEIPVCQGCGQKVFTEAVDRQINQAFHSHLNGTQETTAEIQKAPKG